MTSFENWLISYYLGIGAYSNNIAHEVHVETTIDHVGRGQ